VPLLQLSQLLCDGELCSLISNIIGSPGDAFYKNDHRSVCSDPAACCTPQTIKLH
jgi:hypothetical protein